MQTEKICVTSYEILNPMTNVFENNFIEIRQEVELDEAAARIIEHFSDVRIFLLDGQLGAGKTALVKAFGRVLCLEDEVSSPTFGLVNEYFGKKNGTVYHFDLYRAKDVRELYRIGIEEYLDSGNYCFFEWSALVEDLIESPFVKLQISIRPDFSRMINFTKHG